MPNETFAQFLFVSTCPYRISSGHVTRDGCR